MPSGIELLAAVVFSQLACYTLSPPVSILVKGMNFRFLMQDDGDWKKISLKAGQKLMMMGTADKLPEAPKNVPVFVEDLPEDQQEAALTVSATICMCMAGSCILLKPLITRMLSSFGAPPPLYHSKSLMFSPTGRVNFSLRANFSSRTSRLWTTIL